MGEGNGEPLGSRPKPRQRDISTGITDSSISQGRMCSAIKAKHNRPLESLRKGMYQGVAEFLKSICIKENLPQSLKNF